MTILVTSVQSIPCKAQARLKNAAALALVMVIGGAGLAQAEISVGLGGLGGVSVGGKSIARADVGLGGLKANATVGGKSVADVSASLGNSVNADVEVGSKTSLAKAAVNLGGVGVGADVGTSFSANDDDDGGTNGGTGGGAGGGGQGVGGDDPDGDGLIGVIPRVSTSSQAQVKPMNVQKMRCAKDGNTQVYNGMPVVDRNGAMLGWVHDTTLDQSLRISSISIQNTSNRCMGLVGGSYKVAGGAIKVNVDGTKLR